MSVKLENFLYNGVSLPALPEWNKGINPHAAIVVIDGEYRLYCRAEKIVSSTTTVSISTYGVMFVLTNGEWSESNVGATASTLIWANHDVRTSRGALVLAKSIPIYSISKLTIHVGWYIDPDKWLVTDITFNADDTALVTTDMGGSFGLTFNRDDSGEIVSVTDENGNVFAMPAATDKVTFVEDGDTVTVTEEGVAVMTFVFSRDGAGKIVSVSCNGIVTTLDGMDAPDITPAEFAKWFQLGQSVRRMMGKGAEKYSYNGVVLPKLPEWDKSVRPYAHWHTTALDSGVCALLAYDVRPVMSSDGWLTFKESTAVIRRVAVYDSNIGRFVWESYNWIEENISAGGIYFPPSWVNFDLLNDDGTLYLAATDPIPVYE